jgi:stage V sporulation protein D (sporulation-specific penicillin-binding protein)
MNHLKEHPWRLYLVVALLGAYTTIVVVKLFYIQVVRNDYYTELAKEERWQQRVIPAQRGTILAADGAPLAVSVPFETLYVDAMHLQNKGKVVDALAPILSESQDSISAALAKDDGRPVALRKYLPAEVVDRVRDLRFLHVYFQPEPRRLYPEGSLASQLLGFVGAGHEGLAGLELSWQGLLGGKSGTLFAEMDTAGSAIALGPSDYEAPVRGADIVTTIDRFAQSLIERELDAAMDRHSADAGTIIVMEPSTGAILAMASRPSFSLDDPDLFSPEKESLYDCPAVSHVYEPGSVFKVITMAAGIDSGAVGPDEVYNDQGYFAYDGTVIHNWNGQGYGYQTMAQKSCKGRSTRVRLTLATKLGRERFYQYVSAFGFGQQTDVDLPSDGEGLVRSDPALGWSSSDLLTNSYGQGISVTPLQMVRAIAAVANEGRLMKPQIVREIRTAGGVERIAPQTVRQAISPETASILNDMMVNAVENSVVGLARVEGYQVAGKSGTAEISNTERYSPMIPWLRSLVLPRPKAPALSFLWR